MGSVLPTAALIFTSYIGFIQITTVAGDVINPGKTLPRALFGSIALVSILYLLTVYLATALIDADRLADLGETALTQVAERIMGSIGALVVFSAGLLATLSSANASILGSSRSVLALGQDGVFPRFLSRINRRFGTPHSALLMTGLPISVLILFGRLEVLAEVASILHLLMYSLLCLSLLAFRRRPDEEYRPTFRMPGAPTLPLLGALACLGLVAWMEKSALLLSGGILVFALLWYALFARGMKFEAQGR
jgi:amino acid transporter